MTNRTWWTRSIVMVLCSVWAFSVGYFWNDLSAAAALPTITADQTATEALTAMGVDTTDAATLTGAEQVGRSFAAVRAAVGLSQGAVADSVPGLSSSRLSGIERGTIDPRVSELVALWAYYARELNTQFHYDFLMKMGRATDVLWALR